MTRLLTAQACSLIAIVASQLAFAHAAVAANATDSGALEEIVVTAQKRTENLQTVPIAATVVSADVMKQKGFVQISDLAPFVPGLNIWDGNSFGFPQWTLRGIGSGSYNQNTNSTVGVYLDEFVLDSPTSQTGQTFDLQRIEVLNGPQGTLYGKNTTGGAINFITRKPDGTTEADGTLTVGRWGEYDVEAGAQTALTNNLSIRIAGNRNYSDGYGFNRELGKRVDNTDDWGFRLGLDYKTDDLDLYLKLYTDALDAAQQYTHLISLDPTTGATIPANAYDGYVAPTQLDLHDGQYFGIHTKNHGATLNANYNLGDYTLTSITGYVTSRSDVAGDYDQSPFALTNVPRSNVSSKQFSQELRVTSPDTGAFKWIAGANFLHKNLQTDDLYDLALLGLPLIGEKDYEHSTSYAGFVDGTLKLGGGFSVIGGVRVTHDQKSMHFISSIFSLIGPFNLNSSSSWTEPTYRGILNYQLNSDTLLYASYSHGYRSGSYDVTFKSSPNQLSPVNPEFVNNYETGAKTTVFDNHLRLASALYYMKFTDMQLTALAPYANAICCNLVNAGSSRVYGGEVEATALLTHDFSVNLTGTVSNGKLTKFINGNVNYSGTKLGYLPSYKIRLSPEYRIPFKDGDIFFAPDATFEGSERVSTTPDAFGRDLQRAYIIVDGQVGYRANTWSIFAWIKDATNYRVLTGSSFDPGLGYGELIYSPPRSYGITVSARY